MLCFVNSKLSIGYVGIPKCASTSIKKATLGLTGDNLEIHKQAEKMMAVVESARALGCIIFSFVRHPYTRLSSLWYDRVRAPTWEEAYQVPKDSLYYPGQSVSEFIDRLNKIGVSSDIHTWPQISFLIDRGKIPLDFMGRCETIEEDWKKLQEFRSLPDLEKLNGRVDRPAVLLSKHDKEKIQNLYHQDFATFAFTS